MPLAAPEQFLVSGAASPISRRAEETKGWHPLQKVPGRTFPWLRIFVVLAFVFLILLSSRYFPEILSLNTVVSKIVDYAWEILLIYLLYERNSQNSEVRYTITMENNDNGQESAEKAAVYTKRIGTEERGNTQINLAQSEIDRIVAKIDAPDSINQLASAIYRRSLSEKAIENRTIADITAASVYAACRIDKECYALPDIAKVSHASQQDISQAYADISKDLDLNTGPVDPKTYVSRYCSDLGLTKEEEEKAKEILNETESLLSGRSPSGFAAAAVYSAALLTNRERTQSEVSSVAKVSVETIRNNYQLQIFGLSDDLPNSS